jgi:RHS repeat-associated protein
MELSGDVLNDGQNQYLYDGEGRICAVASSPMPNVTTMTGYLYDADGTRVAKGRITAWSCDPAVNGFQTTNDYILGPGGEQVTEMGVNATAGSSATTLAWQHTNVYAPGLGSSALIATYDNDGLHFYFNDPLGTRRAQTDYAGVIEQTCSSLPFGDALACSGGNLAAPTEHHFTGKERDTESGNDYFEYRYYQSTMGRWMSPDPGWFLAAHLGNPQTWNMYTYANNNPLMYIDPYGLQSVPDATKPCGLLCQIGKLLRNIFSGSGTSGHPGYPSSVPFFQGGYIVPIRSRVEHYPNGVTLLHNIWELRGPQGQILPSNYGVREYINGFDPGGEDENVDGSYSDTDKNVFDDYKPNQYDDELGCRGVICRSGDFWQRFTVTLLLGPDKGKQIPVLIKVNGQLMKALHWQNNGRTPTTSLEFPGPTLPEFKP